MTIIGRIINIEALLSQAVIVHKRLFGWRSCTGAMDRARNGRRSIYESSVIMTINGCFAEQAGCSNGIAIAAN